MTDAATSRNIPANDNLWYCLATAHGEYEEQIDQNLAKKNREAWNRWIAAALSVEQRAEFVRKGFDASELVPLSNNEKSEFLQSFAKRTKLGLPDPKDKIDFDGVHFERAISFESFIFPTEASFTWAAFANLAYFSKTEFSRFANFSHAAFSDSALFSWATFQEGANFSEAAFASASFQKVIFSRSAYFSKATFTKGAIFHEATFSDIAFFMNVTFPPVCRFTRVKFSAATYFQNATFGVEAHFRESTFSDYAFFQKAVFAGLADFTSCAFSLPIDFSRAKFESRVPIFFDSKLREGIDWGQSQWPPPPKNMESAQLQAVAYERLKSEMERQRRHREERFFFAKELRALRELESRYSLLRALDSAYLFFGDYGFSVGRPLIWLSILFFAGASYFALTPTKRGSQLSLSDAAGFSLTNLISVLPFKLDKDLTEHLSTSAKIFGDIQSILGAVLLFLLALALRNRFSIK